MNLEGAVNSRVGNVLVWLLTIGAGGVMLWSGSAKFLQSDMWMATFAGWGYPAVFAYVVGALEMLGAAAAFIPKFATYGAVLVVLIMCGAVFTMVTHGGDPSLAGLNLLCFSIIAYARLGARWTPS
ncbi:MAG: DoxX family protein [Longimicrobiales bacterium]|nr:DoxX family protein [Longimicrobiales bacterium]